MLKYLKKIVNKIWEAIPCAAFWRRYFKKMISYTISLKIHILGISTYLLWIGKIGEGTWQAVVLGIALGKVVLQSVATHKHGAAPLSHAGEMKKKDFRENDPVEIVD